MIYFVSTPIGNLKDITLRAIEVLKSVDVIACEDTRTSKTLLDKYEIKNKLISYHKFNEQEASNDIINLALSGKNIAIISDAGTPLISDPGNILSKKLVENNIEFTVIPGANALLPALMLSGFSTRNFFFAGFLPEKNSEKNKLISEISVLSSSLIFYLAPHNIEKDLSFLFENLGARKACLVKEITKLYESSYHFVLGNELNINLKGEFVLIVEGKEKIETDNLSIKDHVLFYINLGLSKNDAIKKVAKEKNVAKNVIYKEVLNLKDWWI